MRNCDGSSARRTDRRNDDRDQLPSFLSRSRSASGPIVRAHGRTCPQQLLAYDLGSPPARQVLYETDDREREHFRALLQVAGRRGSTLGFRIRHSPFRIWHRSAFRVHSFLALTSAHSSHTCNARSAPTSCSTSASTSSTSAGVHPVLSAPRRWACSWRGVFSTAISARVHSSRRLRSSPSRPISFPYASTTTSASSAGCSDRRFSSSL